MTDMRTLMRDQCALAIVYAEDGAYSRAGEILTELAQAVNAHAERNIADLAGIGSPDSADALAMAFAADKQARRAADRELVEYEPQAMRDLIKSGYLADLKPACGDYDAKALQAKVEDELTTRKDWSKRDNTRDLWHDSGLVQVKHSERLRSLPWYIMSRGGRPNAHLTQVHGRYYATAKAAMIAAEKLIH